MSSAKNWRIPHPESPVLYTAFKKGSPLEAPRLACARRSRLGALAKPHLLEIGQVLHPISVNGDPIRLALDSSKLETLSHFATVELTARGSPALQKVFEESRGGDCCRDPLLELCGEHLSGQAGSFMSRLLDIHSHLYTSPALKRQAL